MAVTASGLFVPSFINILSNTIAVDMSSETGIKCALISNSATPDFTTHDYWSDLSAQRGVGYRVGGRRGGPDDHRTDRGDRHAEVRCCGCVRDGAPR